MASAGPLQELRDAMLCPACQDYFCNPVMLDCGHNFCQACVLRYWVVVDRSSDCPQCRKPFQQRDFRFNWHLASIVPLVKKLQEGRLAARQAEVCERHQKPLRFFCRDDQAALCATCKRTKAHRSHVVVLVDEAAQELKVRPWLVAAVHRKVGLSSVAREVDKVSIAGAAPPTRHNYPCCPEWLCPEWQVGGAAHMPQRLQYLPRYLACTYSTARFPDL